MAARIVSVRACGAVHLIPDDLPDADVLDDVAPVGGNRAGNWSYRDEPRRRR
jgi:hypothetical protein